MLSEPSAVFCCLIPVTYNRRRPQTVKENSNMTLHQSFQDLSRDLCLLSSLGLSFYLLIRLYIANRTSFSGTIVEGRLLRLERQPRVHTVWHIMNDPDHLGAPISDGPLSVWSIQDTSADSHEYNAVLASKRDGFIDQLTKTMFKENNKAKEAGLPEWYYPHSILSHPRHRRSAC